MKRKTKKLAKKHIKYLGVVVVLLLVLLFSEITGIELPFDETTTNEATTTLTHHYSNTTPTFENPDAVLISKDNIPEYTGNPYIVLNSNIPDFIETEITTEAFEDYGELDSLGRCTRAVACLGTETMPTEERGEIGMIKPSGWKTKKYDCVDGKYLYNRCHLIGFQLSGENANKKNLITGTRELNIAGMLPFENLVADYIKETNNHVMYRVTPLFEGNNLLCNGVQIEAFSVEDNGKGISFNVFCYNAQPSIKINYETGESYLLATTTTPK